MTEQTVYIAFDGEEFYDRDFCLAYERQVKADTYKDEIFFYDNNRQPIPLTIGDLDDAYFVNIKTEEARQWFVDRCIDCGSIHPWDDTYRNKEFPLTGFFYYTNDGWRHWQTDNKKLNEIRDYFQLFEED